MSLCNPEVRALIEFLGFDENPHGGMVPFESSLMSVKSLEILVS